MTAVKDFCVNFVLKMESGLATIRMETITNENLEICFRFRFRKEKGKKIPRDFLLHLLSQ